MKQYEAVIKVMKTSGGYATLGFLYREVFKIPNVEWGTKTPFASIRRIVQDERYFFRIRPGLWALNEFKDKLPFPTRANSGASSEETEQFSHSYFQGLLVEIGNLRGFDTFVPNQDRNKRFLQKPLSQITSVHNCYGFTYDHLVKRAQTVDVIWFNQRRMPSTFFEVEHLTDIQNSLLKYSDLQDFYSDFRIVADSTRQREFQEKIARTVFRPISRRVKFLSYEIVSELHARTSAFVSAQRRSALLLETNT